MNNIKIIPLGTVSPFPTKKNNCPGFLIKYKNYNILLDCGNGITKYLQFPNILNNLYVIITHFHKDHFADLGVFEYSSYVFNNLKMLNNKINIYLPDEYHKPKETYSNYEYINENKILKIDDLNIKFHNNNSHSIKTFAVSIEKNDFKIIYTSDIGKTNLNKIINFSKNADIIICESSFIKKQKSLSTTHLNAESAAIIAQKANVKKLILTHFWPLENKKEYLKEAKKVFKIHT